MKAIRQTGWIRLNSKGECIKDCYSFPEVYYFRRNAIEMGDAVRKVDILITPVEPKKKKAKQSDTKGRRP